MKIPLIKRETMQSIIEEVYIKNEDFGIEEFRSDLEKENKEVAIVLYSFIQAIAEYMGEDDYEKIEECIAIGKISCNLLYKSIQKQIEINEMNYD